MNHIYQITGMTCEGCQQSVTEKLSAIPGVLEVSVDLETGKASIDMQEHIPTEKLQKALSDKYQITDTSTKNVFESVGKPASKSKWQQLQPLFLIFAYLFVSSFLLNYKEWNWEQAMLDFMGLFYIVFSFFKFLDLKGFPESFRMYDPLAKLLPIYGWVYPFIELALGVLFLMRIEIGFALIVTLILLGITTIGVIKTLVDKKSIRCACLGTALNLPMTEATFIENAVMLAMAAVMLWKGGFV